MTQAKDTHPDIERMQIELFRNASVARRVSLARSLSRTTLQLAQRAIQRVHFDESEREWWLRFIASHYGRDIAAKVGEQAHIHLPSYQRTSTTHMNDFLIALTSAVEVFDQVGIRYYIGGSLASSAYGVARATADVDLVADLRMEHAPMLVERLRSLYYVDESMIEDAIACQTSFNLLHLPTMIKLDVFIPKQRAFDQEVARRTRQDTLEEGSSARHFNLASPEDVVLTKLEWYRAGNEISDRQWNDILGVLKTQGAVLDRAYLERWAAVLNVADLLERALKEAGL